jgi:hypothetical protein
MKRGAVRWSCARCEVSVGRIDGEPTRLPETWVREDGLIYCLSCSRARAGEAAIEAAPETVSREDLARLRRNALIEFEIARAPAAPNRTVALACRTSSAAVAAIRDRLGMTVAEASGPAAEQDG